MIIALEEAKRQTFEAREVQRKKDDIEFEEIIIEFHDEMCETADTEIRDAVKKGLDSVMVDDTNDRDKFATASHERAFKIAKERFIDNMRSLGWKMIETPDGLVISWE